MCWPTRRAGVAQHVRLQRLAGTYVWYVVHLSGQACGWVPDGVATQLAWRLAHNVLQIGGRFNAANVLLYAGTVDY